jgi:hypothetical protein
VVTTTIVSRLLPGISITLILLCVAVGASAQSQATVGTLAHPLLLSPEVHRSQVLTWNVQLADRTVYATSHGPVARFWHLGGSTTCAVLDDADGPLLVSRTVTMFGQGSPQLPTGLRGFLKSHAYGVRDFPVTVRQPSIVIRDGHEFKLDGSRLFEDPLCKFYSASTYGDPPRMLSAGVTWDFHQPLSFGRRCQWLFSDSVQHCSSANKWVHVTVTEVDAKQRYVYLQVVTMTPSTKKTLCLINMAIRDGGLIAGETDQCSFAPVSAIPEDVGTPSSILVFRLNRG